MTGHDRPESLVTIDRNTQAAGLRARIAGKNFAPIAGKSMTLFDKYIDAAMPLTEPLEPERGDQMFDPDH